MTKDEAVTRTRELMEQIADDALASLNKILDKSNHANELFQAAEDLTLQVHNIFLLAARIQTLEALINLTGKEQK